MAKTFMEKQSALELFISDAALKLEMELSNVLLVDGMSLGCTDIDLVNITSNGRDVGVLIFQSDLESLANGIACERLEFGITSALSRLQKIVER